MRSSSTDAETDDLTFSSPASLVSAVLYFVAGLVALPGLAFVLLSSDLAPLRAYLWPAPLLMGLGLAAQAFLIDVLCHIRNTLADRV